MRVLVAARPCAWRARAPRRCGTAAGPGARRRRTCSAAAAITPSGAPPVPNSTSMPESGFAVITAPETSPSPIRRIRAPAWRTSPIRSVWRSRSRMTAVHVLDLLALGLRDALEVPGRRLAQSITPRASGPTAIFCMYVSGALRNWPSSAIAITLIASGAPVAHRFVPSSGSTAMSTFGESVAVASSRRRPARR